MTNNSARESDKDVFQKEEVADDFEKTRKRPDGVVESLINNLSNYLVDRFEDRSRINVFEGGVGTGRALLPLIRQLDNSPIDASFRAVDKSDSMLSGLEEKLRRSDRSFENLDYGYGDLDERLPYEDGSFDCYVMSTVLQCVEDWKFTIDEGLRLLGEEGVLAISNKPDEWSYMYDNAVDDPSDVRFADFWEEYYRKRHEMGVESSRELELVYNAEPVLDYLEQEGFSLDTHTVSWDRKRSFGRMLDLIRYPIFSFNVGVQEEDREELYNHMKSYLDERGISKEEEVAVEEKLALYIASNSEASRRCI